MAKINETLSDEAHVVLRSYQFNQGYKNQGDALNAFLINYGGSSVKSIDDSANVPENRACWKVEHISMHLPDRYEGDLK